MVADVTIAIDRRRVQHEIDAGAGGIEPGRAEQVDGVRGTERDLFQRRRGMGGVAVDQRVEQSLIEEEAGRCTRRGNRAAVADIDTADRQRDVARSEMRGRIDTRCAVGGKGQRPFGIELRAGPDGDCASAAIRAQELEITIGQCEHRGAVGGGVPHAKGRGVERRGPLPDRRERDVVADADVAADQEQLARPEGDAVANEEVAAAGKGHHAVDDAIVAIDDQSRCADRIQIGCADRHAGKIRRCRVGIDLAYA